MTIHRFFLYFLCVDDVITLDIKCHKARLGVLHLGDLGLSPKALEDFTNTPDAILTEVSLLDQWLHVLPRYFFIIINFLYIRISI